MDLPAVVAHALAHTQSGHERRTLVGCLLGATTVLTWLALTPDAPVSAFVNVGGPLRWVEVPDLIRDDPWRGSARADAARVCGRPA